MWIFDSYHRGSVELWDRGRGSSKPLTFRYQPSFYLHLEDPHFHWEMIEGLESRFKVKECSFDTVYGPLEGYEIFAPKDVALKIEKQTRLQVQLYNVDLRVDQRYLADKGLFPCGDEGESRFDTDFCLPLTSLMIQVNANPQLSRTMTEITVKNSSRETRLNGSERQVLADLFNQVKVCDPDANGGHVLIGPFTWTPQIVDHECLLAVVSGAGDRAISDIFSGELDHSTLVRFDNNVGQRNVKPVPSTPGGKTKTSFLIRGTTLPSTNSLRLDASTLPPDTKISVRVARTITDQAAGLSGFILREQNSRWSTLSLAGGAVGTIDEFSLAIYEEKSVTLDIDFSYQAEHLKRYPIVAGQVQDGVLAGQLTIEITAVKESEDYVYGNARSRELHTFNCVYRKKMKPYNQLPFETIKDGLARGYNGCAFCLPEYNSG